MKKITLFILFAFTVVHANGFDYAKAYFENDFSALKKLAEKQLQKEEFWHAHLKDKNLKFGYYQNGNYNQIVVVDKVNQLLNIYDGDKNMLKSVPAVVGERLGDKWYEGDLRTPLGVYNFIRRIPHVDPFYGPLAIVTDYPNFYDKMHDKTGSGIWLHGFPMDDPFKIDTEGCVAIDNDLLVKVDALIDHEKAIMITNEEGFMTTDVDEIAKIMAFIYQWRYAWKYDELDRYISMYNQNFKWHNGMDIDQFIDHKKRVFKIAKNREIDFSDFEVIPYPTGVYDERIFKVTMHQDYSASNYRSSGQKKLFIKMSSDDNPTIILEK